MNKQQRNYLIATAQLKEVKKQIEKIDEELTIAHNVKDENGNLIKVSWHLPDGIFEKVNEEFGKRLATTTLQEECNELEDKLKKAENELIEYALSIAPTKQRKILAENVKVNYTTRKTIIDLALSLDTTTVPKQVRK